MFIGESSTGADETFYGKVSCARVWDAALSQAELEAEMASSTIVRTANINTAFLNDYATDVSGNSRPWTGVGSPTLSTVNYPPISFGGVAAYRPFGFTLPAYTVSGKWLHLGCIYNMEDACWDVVSILKQ